MLAANRGGFSIIELCVTIAIIGVLISVLTPALLHAKRSAKEIASIVSITNYCNMEFAPKLNGEVDAPRSFVVAGQVRCGFGGLFKFDPQVWIDPFRSTPISLDPKLALLGAMVDADYPPNGFGYFFMNIRTSGMLFHPSQPFFSDPAITALRLPADTQYVVWGVGRNGVLDGDPQRDLVLIKTPVHDQLVHHH